MPSVTGRASHGVDIPALLFMLLLALVFGVVGLDAYAFTLL